MKDCKNIVYFYSVASFKQDATEGIIIDGKSMDHFLFQGRLQSTVGFQISFLIL